MCFINKLDSGFMGFVNHCILLLTFNAPSQLSQNHVVHVSVFSYLPVDVLLQANGAVGGGAAAQRIRRSTAALALPFPFSLELPRLHLLQRLDGHSVHGALQWGSTHCEPHRAKISAEFTRAAHVPRRVCASGFLPPKCKSADVMIKDSPRRQPSPASHFFGRVGVM